MGHFALSPGLTSYWKFAEDFLKLLQYHTSPGLILTCLGWGLFRSSSLLRHRIRHLDINEDILEEIEVSLAPARDEAGAGLRLRLPKK